MRKRTNAHGFVERRHVAFHAYSSAQRNKLIKRTTHGSISSFPRRDWQHAKSVLESPVSVFVSQTPRYLSKSSIDFLTFPL